MQARFDVDSKRTKLAKLRGTAGIKASIFFCVAALVSHDVIRHNPLHLCGVMHGAAPTRGHPLHDAAV